MVDLRLAYVVGLLAAIVNVVQSMKFVEPPTEGDTRAAGFITQMKQALGYFSHPLLRWLLAFCCCCWLLT